MIEDLFLKIIKREIPAQIEHETDELICFHDIDPQAPLHLLIAPKRHIGGTDRLDDSAEHQAIVGKLVTTAAKIARDKGYTGYRLVFNCGEEGGQTVGHIHVHLLAGRPMAWPPG